MPPTHSILKPFVDRDGVCILDGGLATELEQLGNDLNHPLWSARIITSHPDDLTRVHRSFLEAGADCIASASYQATIPGLVASGMSAAEARNVLVASVDLACSARDEFVDTDAFKASGRLPPVVAASIGPYGAYLADGSEYLGNYGNSTEDLREFHLPRWEVLANSRADLIACETIPSLREAEVLLRLAEDAELGLWISFSCCDGERISDGTPLAECARVLDGATGLAAIGINCTPPRFVSSLIDCIREEASDITVAVYPNSGELYSIETRTWTGIADPITFTNAGSEWLSRGATIIGGCCRTSPQHINSLRNTLVQDKRHRDPE